MNQPPGPSDIHLDPHGTLTPPGLIGRLVRLLLGAYLSFHAWQVLTVTDVGDVDHPMMWVSVIVALWLLPPVVNIGFGVDGKRHHQRALIVLGVLAAGTGWWLYGTPLSLPTWWWMKGIALYTWTHLGLSFVFAAILATPGCEMRAIPDLIARLTRRPAKEHFCPGFIRQLDEWESRVFKRGGQFGPGSGGNGDA